MHQLQKRITNLVTGGIALTLLILTLLGLLTNMLSPAALILAALMLICLGAIYLAGRAGWPYDRHTLVLLIVLAVGFGTEEPPYLTQQVTLSVFLPTVVALVLLSPRWVVISAVLLELILITRGLAGYGASIHLEPTGLILRGIIIGGLLTSRWIIEVARREAEASSAELRVALARSEAQSHELSLRSAQLAEVEQDLRDLVSTLETPTIGLADGVLLAPVVGALDSRRAELIITRLLKAAYEQRARYVVLDIAGVGVVDTAVAQTIVRAVQSLRLIGCETIITGVSASVAITLAHLGAHLEARTARSPQEALALIKE